ncbi:MAG: sugar phosphate isomerase/epimerase [Oscillospiraceae bacterium]|nr:sugar phosphate isomerase/epimerase [Oscillospiraceae bacterium]
MNKGCNLEFDRTLSLAEGAFRLAEAGFTHTFVVWGFAGEGVRAAAAAFAAGLTVETVHASYGGVNEIWLDSPEGEKRMDYFLSCVRGAAAIGVKTVILHLSSGDTPPPFGEVGRRRYARICREAERLGVAVGFENLRKTSYLTDLFAGVESPARKFCYDCGHERLYDGGDGVLERYGEHLVAVHLHDNGGAQDDHLLPFTGCIDWERLTRRLRPFYRANPSLPITLELKQTGGNARQTGRDFAREAYAAACRIERMLLAEE